MIRIVLENVIFFLLPTIAYVAWVAYMRDDWPGLGVVLKAAPLLNLFVLGAGLMLVTLIVVSSLTSGGKPGEVYQPSVFTNGHVEQGHIVREPKNTPP